MSRISRKASVSLWVAQSLLAVLFLFAGTMKFFEPIETMQQSPIRFSAAFFHFIGTCEALAGLGLVLPGLFRTQQYLTPLAAAGLVIIMLGATVVNAPVSLIGSLVTLTIAAIAFAIFKGRGGYDLLHNRRAVASSLATHS